MEDSMSFNILSTEFDPSVLLNESENVPLDPENDLFYRELLSKVKDENLRTSLEDIRNNKTSLGTISHAVYLLPWKKQPIWYCEDKRDEQNGSSGANTENNNELKTYLKDYIKHAKGEGELTRELLRLRLTGYSNVRNMTYKYLREAYEANVEIIVRLRPSVGVKPVRYQGTIVLFDRESNMLLSNARVYPGDTILPFIYIR
ncbi:hypothetical protein BgAZ_110940 [Babesia gibsoni]|uniref:Uncharacterized protein n=1 Tax=Babesia gibsoni TaxID=33632 RepID=A0AAD8PH47_BABGI|nr:hypothetical protein BgAZ_110940 [Babesia gibsoni]